MRSRFASSGSLTAHTMNVGAFDFSAGRSPPMGTPFAYPVFTQSLLLQDVRCVIPAAEEPHLDAHAAGAEGLLALHGGEDRFARVLFCPHAAAGRRCEQLVHRQAGCLLAAQAGLRRGVEQPVTSEIVRLAYARRRVVRSRSRRRRRTCTGCSRASPASPGRSRTPRGCSCRGSSARGRRRPGDSSRISCPANSSLGDSAGCVSDAPLS